MYEDSIKTHEEYLNYIQNCYGDMQSKNSYRILSFLSYSNENAIQRVSNNPETSITAYYSVRSTKRWAGIITGKDKILLLADDDIINKYKDKIGQQNLKIANFSWKRGAIVIPTTIDGGFVDEEGNLTLDMGFITDFGEFCLSDNTPSYGKLDI